MKISLNVNGAAHHVEAEPRYTLSDLVRDKCGLTGTHVGCEHGVCGACTVLLEGRPTRSCLVYAAQAEGASIVTVEGMEGTDGRLHPLQESFAKCHGLQCGFCTPGMLVTAMDLLDRDPDPSRETVREEMAGNLCRCTGYETIVDAVLDAAATMRAESESDDESGDNR